MSDYLTDLKKNIKAGKTSKVKTLLADLSSRHMQQKLEILELLALAADKPAFEFLTLLTRPEHKDDDIHDRLIQLITDRAHLNFNFIFILLNNGDKKVVNHSIPLIRHILSNETDKDLLNRLIRKAGMRKVDGLTDDIAEFIFYDDILLKSESVKALERIGSPKALDTLIKASNTDKCDDDILDAIQVLSASINQVSKTEGEPSKPASTLEKPEESTSETQADEDSSALAVLLSNLTSTQIQKRFNAYNDLSAQNPKAIAKLLRTHPADNHDLTINLLTLVKRTIPFSAAIKIFDILKEKGTPATVKFAAYSALEAYPELKSAASVVKGLSESSLAVRIAAIRVLNKNLSDFVFAEIKNKIESGTQKGETLAENILDANAENIIEQLMISDTFSYIASNYLSRNAPITCLDTFIRILEKRRLKSTARKYLDIKDARMTEPSASFVIVSGCESVLNIYNKLICTCGFSALLFRQPQDAFEALLAQKPLAVVSDLFLGDITGLDFAKEIRDLYPVNDVPVILSTLQKNLDSSVMENEMKTHGVNNICDFPATVSQIKSWVK